MKIKNFIFAITCLMGVSAYSAHKQGCEAELVDQLMKRPAKHESHCDKESWSISLKGQTASAYAGPLSICIEGSDGEILVKGTNKCIDRDIKTLTINLAELCQIIRGIKVKFSREGFVERLIEELSECHCEDHHKKPAHDDGSESDEEIGHGKPKGKKK